MYVEHVNYVATHDTVRLKMMTSQLQEMPAISCAATQSDANQLCKLDSEQSKQVLPAATDWSD